MRLGPLEIVFIIVIIIAAVIIARIARRGRGNSTEHDEPSVDITGRPRQRNTNRFQGFFKRTGIGLVVAGIILLIAGIGMFQWAFQSYMWSFVIIAIGFILVLLTRGKR